MKVARKTVRLWNEKRQAERMLKMALMLAITAPDDARAVECVRHAESAARILSPETIHRIQAEIEAAL